MRKEQIEAIALANDEAWFVCLVQADNDRNQTVYATQIQNQAAIDKQPQIVIRHNANRLIPAIHETEV